MTVYPRVRFPDAASIDRVQATAGAPLQSAAGAVVRVYLDAAGTQLADILNADETPNATSTLILDSLSRLPEFYGPVSGVEKLWVRIDGGTPLAVFAQIDVRLAALQTTVQQTLDTQTAGVASTLATFQVTALASIQVQAAKANSRQVRECAFGDSIMYNGSNDPSRVYGENWVNYASLMSGGLTLTVRNAAVAGNKTADMLARFAADIAAHAADFDVVSILAGTNDALNGVSLATTTTNLKSIVNQCWALGLGVRMFTIPPNNDSSKQAPINKLNLWLRRWCARNRIPLIDLHSAVVDPATGGYKNTWSPDGTHPALAAQQAMAQQYAAWLKGTTPTTPAYYLSPSNVDPINLYAKPLFLTDATNPGTPDGWTKNTNGTGFTDTVEAHSTWPGRAQKSVKTTADSHTILDQLLTAGVVSQGQVLAYACRVAAVGVYGNAGDVVVRAGWTYKDGAPFGTPADIANREITADLPDESVVTAEATVPTGVNQLRHQVIVRGTQQNNSTIWVSAPTMVNLTALGIPDL